MHLINTCSVLCVVTSLTTIPSHRVESKILAYAITSCFVDFIPVHSVKANDQQNVKIKCNFSLFIYLSVVIDQPCRQVKLTWSLS